MLTINFFRFVVESGLSMILLYGLYYFLFRKESYFRFNRFYLLSTLLFSVLIPFVSFKAFIFQQGSREPGILMGLTEVLLTAEEPGALSTPGHQHFLNWQNVLLLLYLAGAFLVLGRFILGLLRIRSILSKGRRERKEGFVLVHTKEDLAPFSFFRTICIPDRGMKPDKLQYILGHELEHIRQGHTADNILTELMLAVFWYNPVMWLLRKSLRNTHEFLADEGVLKGEATLSEYQTVLLGFVRALAPQSVSNNFNSLIKSRIQMMHKENSGVLARMKTLFILPVILSLTFVFACTEMQPEAKPKAANDPKAKESTYFIVDEMPVFNGGDPRVEFQKYIDENLVYPEAAKENGTSGEVILQLTVNKRGKVQDVIVVRGVDPLLDQEAVRVLESSPDWTPGRKQGEKVSVLYTFRVYFKL